MKFFIRFTEPHYGRKKTTFPEKEVVVESPSLDDLFTQIGEMQGLNQIPSTHFNVMFCGTVKHCEQCERPTFEDLEQGICDYCLLLNGEDDDDLL